MEKALKNCYPILKKQAGIWAKNNKNIDYDDFLGLGHEVFMDCWDSFNPEKGCKFTSYFQRYLNYAFMDFTKRQYQETPDHELLLNIQVNDNLGKELLRDVESSKLSHISKNILISAIKGEFGSDHHFDRYASFCWGKVCEKLKVSWSQIMKPKQEIMGFLADYYYI